MNKLNGSVKIEKGIPLPPTRGRYSELICKMKKGDSVLLPMDTNRACSAARYALGKSGLVTCRKVAGGTRVWRL